MKNLKLNYKIILLNVAVLLIFLLAVCFVYARVEFNFIGQKKMAVKRSVETILSNIDHYILDVENGLISTEQAKQSAIELIEQTRDEEGNYFWVNDMTPRMIIHPTHPDLNGKDLSQYSDPSGNLLFVKMAEIVRRKQAGYLKYDWPKPESAQPVPKISYVRGIPEWGWVIGSGLYLDDIYVELAKIRNIFIGVTLLGLCFSLLMTYFALRSIALPLSKAITMIQNIDKGNLDSRLDLQRTDEVGILADELNKFADNMQNEILAAFKALSSGDFSFEANGVIRQPLEKTNRALAELIASKKKITKDLEEQKNTIKLLLNSTAEGVYGLDREGRCIFCNDSALEMLNYEEKELIGKPVHDLIAHTRADGSLVSRQECLLNKIVTGEKKYHNAEEILWSRDGHWLNVDYRMHPLKRDKQTVGAVVSFIDNTEKKKELNQRMRTSQLAALGELSAGMAHEINNPVSGVINYAQILLNRHKNNGADEEKEITKRIIKEGERIATIVQNLLSFAHKNRDSMAPVKIHEVIMEPLEMVQQRLINDGIYLDVDIESDLPEIIGNAQRLEQVVLNLINNSRHALNEKFPKSNPDKLLRISARKIDEGSDSRLQMTIWDQGCGIPEKNMERIFNTFFTTKPAGVGTGLGLSISHDIIIEHNATINIESDPGLFTKVTMEFPIFNGKSSAPLLNEDLTPKSEN